MHKISIINIKKRNAKGSFLPILDMQEAVKESAMTVSHVDGLRESWTDDYTPNEM